MVEERTPGVAAEIGDELQSWRNRILNVVLLVVSLAATTVVLSRLIQAIRTPGLWPQTVPFLVAYPFLLTLAVLRRLDYRLRVWGLLGMGYVVGILYLWLLGLVGNGMLPLLVMPVLGVILLGTRYAWSLVTLSLAIYAAFALAAHLGWLADWLIVQENTLELSRWLSQGVSFALMLIGLVVIQSLFSQLQARSLQQARNTAEELGVARDELQAHAEQLDRYARFLEAAVHISSDITSLLDRESLLRQATDLLAKRLDLDRVAIYLVDAQAAGREPEGQEAVGKISLSAVSGDRAETESGARPPQSQEPMVVAQVVQHGTFQVDEFVAKGRTYHELALPLTAGQVIGALDVQAARPIPFGDQEISALQVMANQLAVALENARLYTETQANLRDLDALYRHYSTESWQDFMRIRPGTLHTHIGSQKVPDEAWQALFEQARSTGAAATAVSEENGYHLLAVPVKMRDLSIGVLGFHRSTTAGAWDSGEITAIEAVAGRMAFAADNLRLLETTQHHAARDRLVDQITSQVQGLLDPDTILKTAVRELGRTLGARLATIEITGPQDNDDNHPEEETTDEE